MPSVGIDVVAGGACKEDSAQHAWFFEEVNVPLSSNGRALSLTHLWLERVALRCALKLGLLLLSPVCRIERLRLSSNYLRNDSAVALASALRTQESLRLLDLANNLIGDEGARAFAEALKLNTVMESCSLSHNNISEASKVALREVEVARESLTIFV
mmetsp:Transcript_11982/g.27367  ORF Transcript_11982/g.27367 Transcript_11982/m.27367 type:complete len:157 (-) Transcript_11982:168-638(-)